MVERMAEASLRFQFRMAGVFAWISTTEGFALLVDTFDFWVRGRLVVYSDAASTAHNVLSHELLYRLAVIGDIISHVACIFYIPLLYKLFRPG